MLVFRNQDFIVLLAQDAPRLPEHGDPQADFNPLFLLREREVALGLFRLLFEGADPAFELGKDVVQAHEVLFGLRQPALGVLFAVAEPGDAGRLLKNLPPVLAARGDDAVDAALADHGVAVAAEACVHEQLVDVPEADGAVVDAVLAFAGAVVAPRHGDRVGVAGKLAPRVVDLKGHLGKAEGFAPRRAAEDHVLHLRAAQRAGGLLPQHPADGVAEVAFSAAVRPYDGGDPVVEREHRLVGERLEPLELQRFKKQLFTPLSFWPARLNTPSAAGPRARPAARPLFCCGRRPCPSRCGPGGPPP